MTTLTPSTWSRMRIAARSGSSAPTTRPTFRDPQIRYASGSRWHLRGHRATGFPVVRSIDDDVSTSAFPRMMSTSTPSSSPGSKTPKSPALYCWRCSSASTRTIHLLFRMSPAASTRR